MHDETPLNAYSFGKITVMIGLEWLFVLKKMAMTAMEIIVIRIKELFLHDLTLEKYFLLV